MKRSTCVELRLVWAVMLGLVSEVCAAPQAPTGLAVEDRVEPIGVGDATPDFAWLPQDSQPDAVQGTYRILVASRPELLADGKADKWDSGQVKTSTCAYVAYQGKPLQSREVYWWAVRTADGQGNWGPWSQPARFEIGLLKNEDWAGAKWIWAQDDKPLVLQHYYFRKTIQLPDKPVARGRLYVSSVHHHLLYVDDQLVGTGQNLENPEYQYYQTFDITPFLKPGKQQVLGARCHWFKDGQGRPGSKPGLLYKAVIDFEDGSTMVVGTDGTWKSRRAEWYYEGKSWRRNGEGIPTEYLDGREYPEGWNLPAYDDSGWAGVVELGPQPTAPWVNTLLAQEASIDAHELKPIKVTKLKDNIFVADFGKVYAGRPRITFSGGIPGAMMIVKCDYWTREDGTLDAFDQGTKLDYEYILRGGQETLEPFWYHGVRYVSVEPGKKTVQNGRKTTVLEEYQLPAGFDGSSIRIVARHNKVDLGQSSFECSDRMINAVWELCRHSCMDGSQEGYVDTPTREQGQFTHDSYQTSIAAMKCFGERDLAQEALHEFAHSQDKWWPGGQVNAVYPYGGKRDIPDWTQSWVMWAHDYYMQTGDLELIGEIFDHLAKTGEYDKNSENKQTGLIDWGSCEMDGRGSSYRTGIVDWPERYGYDMTTTQRTVLSCNAYQNYLAIAQMAKAIGRGEAAEHFAGYARDIREAIQKRLWNDKKQAYVDGLYADGTQSANTSQQANMVPLALGLTEDNPAMTRGAMDAVKRAGFSTAPMIVRYLIRAYGEQTEGEALYDYLTDPNGLNWAHIISVGGTFTWESWSGKDSQSHPVSSYAGVMACQDYILGLTPLEPQYARIRIRPVTCGLKYAKGTVPTQRGPVCVDWKDEKDFSMTLSIPCNVRADVYVPKSRHSGAKVKMDGKSIDAADAGKYLLIKNVGSGKHEFVLVGD